MKSDLNKALYLHICVQIDVYMCTSMCTLIIMFSINRDWVYILLHLHCTFILIIALVHAGKLLIV